MSVTQGRKATRLASWAATLAVAAALAVGTPVPVAAAASNIEFDLPAGVACAFRSPRGGHGRQAHHARIHGRERQRGTDASCR